MHKEATRTLVRRLFCASVLCGTMGAVAVDAASAEEGRTTRLFRRVFRRDTQSQQQQQQSPYSQNGYDAQSPYTTQAAYGQNPYEVQQIQNQPPDFNAAEKEGTFEEPGTQAQQQPAQPDFAADEKEKAPEEPEEPWTLTNLFDNRCGQNWLKDNGWKISGHSQWGYQTGPDGAFDGNGPFLNQQQWGQFNLNQQYLFIEKVADGSKGLGWGARFDAFYGVDGSEGQSFGNINPGHWDFQNGFDHGAYAWALPQLYGELAYGDWSVKGGHFYTIVGYEVVPSTGQFFFSRQLTFWNSEPFTHTGFLASYKASDKLTAMGGWVLGWDTGFYQFGNGSAFIGGFTYKPDDKSTLVYSMTGGNLGWRGQGAVNSFIYSRKWFEKFETVHQFDVLGTNMRVDANGVPTPNSSTGTPASFASAAGGFTARNSIGFINYAFYDVTDKVKAGLRGEWYKADGTSYYTLTGGVNYHPWSWLLIRPEVRGMWSPGNHQEYTGVHGYHDELYNQVNFGIDAIIIF